MKQFLLHRLPCGQRVYQFRESSSGVILAASGYNQVVNDKKLCKLDAGTEQEAIFNKKFNKLPCFCNIYVLQEGVADEVSRLFFYNFYISGELNEKDSCCGG